MKNINYKLMHDFTLSRGVNSSTQYYTVYRYYIYQPTKKNSRYDDFRVEIFKRFALYILLFYRFGYIYYVHVIAIIVEMDQPMTAIDTNTMKICQFHNFFLLQQIYSAKQYS